MKLLQLNAWAGRLEPQIRDFVTDQQPDIICLQEAINFHTESGLFITTTQIQELCGLQYDAFAPVFSFSYMKGVAEFGNGILSRQPITDSRTVFTYMEHIDNFAWGEHSSNVRNFIHTRIMVENKLCHVITHHGFWVPAHKNGNDETMRQMQLIADYVSQLEGPIILTGDFNLAPNSESLQGLNEMLTNLSITYKLPTTRTELTHKTETCDYIFVNDQVKVLSFGTHDKIVSDHKALILEFEV